ncbi:MAG TPA: DUF2950 domain-containing protein, partial [Thermoanaerobaculia bacterium]
RAMKISKTWRHRAAIGAALILFTCAFAAVSKDSAAPKGPKGKVYATPDAAVEAFVGAIREYNLDTLLAIFGKGAERIFVTDDPVADENARKQFLKLYDEKHALTPRDDKNKKTMILAVGNDPWPLPIPLVKAGSGWAFDTAAGIEEVINRRIGRNELSAIQTCLAVGDAQREYYRLDRDGDGILEYAQKFRSTPGKQDGLYWPVKEGEPQSPIGEFVATASTEGYGPGSTAYHGYHYRLLTKQSSAAPGGAYDYMVQKKQIGGFAVVAFPAAYGDSGIMTFMLSHSGIVYQKDLGKETQAKAEKIKSFDPAGWKKVDDKDLQIIPEP